MCTARLGETVSGGFGEEPANTGGGRGIRTPERVTPLTVFKTAAFNHSAIPPLTILPAILFGPCDTAIPRNFASV